ncbi:MAG: hypothetical protein ACXVZW_06775 [Gaiellaceae bacterium]
MRRRRGIWIVGLLAAALGAAAVGVHASSAAPTRATALTSTIDKTYSCPVRRQHFVEVFATVTYPPVNNQPQQPGALALTTVVKTINHNGTQETLTQLSLQARKNSLRIDQSSCRRVKQQIPLTRKGLPGTPLVARSDRVGDDNVTCGTTARVLFRLRLKLTNGTPIHALLAIRNQKANNRPVAFYNWTAHKVSAYLANSCVSTG